MGDIAREAGLNRESLYKALGEAGNPEFGTMLGVLRSAWTAIGGAAAADKSQAGPSASTPKAA